MRILHVVHDFLPLHVAGVEVYTDHVARAQAAQHEVAILYSEVVPEAEDFSLRRGRHGAVATYELVNNHRFRRFEETYRHTAVDQRVAEVLDEFRPELVHIQHLLNLSLGVSELATRRGIPVVMTLHDHWLECAHGGQRFHRQLGRCDELDARRCASCTAHLHGVGLRARGWARRLGAVAASGAALDLADLSPSSEKADAPDLIRRNSGDLDPLGRAGWIAHPPARLRFDVDVDSEAVFEVDVAMHPSTFGQPGGGVRFRVHVDGRERAEQVLDPKRRARDRMPVRLSVPLAAGHRRVELETTAWPDERPDYCTAGWIAPRVLALSGGARLRGSPWLEPLRRLATAALRAPIGVQERRIRRRWAAMRGLGAHVQLFIAPSRYLRDELLAFGLPPERVVHCDYGFPSRAFRRRTDLPERVRRFGFVGSLVPHKGAHLLLRAFASLPADATLDVCGSLEYAPEYARGLLEQVHHPGIRFRGGLPPSAVPGFLHEVDALVVPSIWRENSPLTIHEAFLTGLPVVASRLGGHEELLHDGGGLLYETDSPQALAKALRRLYDEADLARQLARRAPPVKSLEEHLPELQQLYARARGAGPQRGG